MTGLLRYSHSRETEPWHQQAVVSALAPLTPPLWREKLRVRVYMEGGLV